MKENGQVLSHKPSKCFSWWKQWMTKKYGPDIKWFDVIARQKDCFKLKAFDFKRNLEIILRGTQHSKCFNSIASLFPKVNYLNQKDSTIFMNTIKVSTRPIYIQKFKSKKQLSKSSFHQSNSKSHVQSKFHSRQKVQRAMTQTSQTFYINDFEWENNQKNERHSNHFSKGKIINHKPAKSLSLYSSVPIKEIPQKKKKNHRYQSTVFQKGVSLNL